MTRSDSGLGPLADGGRAVVVGGGPGGVAAAIALKQEARALGRELRVTVVEGKQFAGEQHNNLCTGVLSPPIVELMERDLSVPFPHPLSRGAVTGYVLHAARREIVLDGKAEPSVALRRVHYDAYMLDAARERGIEIVCARVTGLEFHAGRVVIYTENAPLEADVVVGAFGLDEGTATLFEDAVGYRPPPALISIVTKYHPGDDGMAAFGGRIHAFLPATPRIEFGAITPKGNHLTINIAGAAVDADLMSGFLGFPEVRRALPCFENARRFDSNDLRYFRGRFPCGLARNFSGDRFVMVGDAAGLVRAFKGKGVTSAIQAGIRAARVILRDGISARAFEGYHAANRDIISDLPYGHAARRLTILAARLGLMDVVLRAAESEAGLRRALFDAASAHRPYRDVIREGLTPASVTALAAAFFQPRQRQT
jgi:flavin-dependent dehydrogenase